MSTIMLPAAGLQDAAHPDHLEAPTSPEGRPTGMAGAGGQGGLFAAKGESDALHEKGAEPKPHMQRIADLEQTVAELMRSKDDLEAVVQMESHMLSHVAHELRTPLVAIRGYTKMILDGSAGEINNTQREYLTIVSENTTRLVDLISTLLRVSGSPQIRGESFDIRALWQDCARLITSCAREKSLKITEEIPPEPLIVTGDRRKLRQVLDSLLSNAVKFTDENGTVSVAFSRNQDEVRVKVSDTGAGIPQEVLDTIFERYHRGEPALSRACSFAGISLSAAREIIRLHGGRISVASRVGEGSTFVFSLPAARPRKHQEVRADNEQAGDLSSR
jgi:signal transduction histidine kinase